MYVRRITLENFKCFERADVNFCWPGCRTDYPNINLILGDNGSGKSTLLQGISLAILGSVLPNQGYRPHGLIREPSVRNREARITAIVKEGSDEQEFVTTVRRKGSEQVLGLPPTGRRTGGTFEIPEELWSVGSPAYFLCGYGTLRRAAPRSNYDPEARDKSRGRKYQRVASLFEDFELTSVSGWFQESSSGRNGVDPHWDEYVEILSGLLEDTGIGLAMRSIDGEVHFRAQHTDQSLPYSFLAEGHRAHLAWACDLLRHLGDVTPAKSKLRQTPGVVLVDELDLHLHPSWERRILPQLSRCLPRLQFIVTSHSPVLAGSIPRRNVWFADRGENGTARLIRSDKDYYGRSVDEILTGSYFQLRTTLSPDLEAEREAQRGKMNELARAVMTGGDEAAAKAYLKALRES